VSTDLFYDGRQGEERDWLEQGARAVEMEAATLFALAARRDFAAGAVLIVSDVLIPQRTRIDADALTRAEVRLGAVATEALAA
jgi:purine-nucleoside phosphorylase